MALPLLGLAARSALSLARNKKMSDALTKSVSKSTRAFKMPKTSTIAKATIAGEKKLKKAKFPKPSTRKGLSTGAKVGLGFGDGVASGITTDKKLREAKKVKKIDNTSVTKKPKRKPAKFR